MKKLSFCRFLLKEGGKATAEWGTERVLTVDMKEAISKISKALSIDESELSSHLIGTSRLTYNKIKSSSGDIDIAFKSEDPQKTHEKMMQLCSDRGLYNTGTQVGSYALEVNGKKVQVDLMFVDSVDFAKFMYHSSEGEKSEYPGAVRNIMLMTLVAGILENGKDFVLKQDGEIIARASRSLKLNVGLERLFKVAKMRKDGTGRTKSLEKVTPAELETELKDLDPSKVGSFDKDPDIINNPDSIAKFIFGNNAAATDIMTAEQVSALINSTFSGSKLEKIKANIIKQLEKSKFPVPKEL